MSDSFFVKIQGQDSVTMHDGIVISSDVVVLSFCFGMFSMFDLISYILFFSSDKCGIVRMNDGLMSELFKLRLIVEHFFLKCRTADDSQLHLYFANLIKYSLAFGPLSISFHSASKSDSFLSHLTLGSTILFFAEDMIGIVFRIECMSYFTIHAIP